MLALDWGGSGGAFRGWIISTLVLIVMYIGVVLTPKEVLPSPSLLDIGTSNTTCSLTSTVLSLFTHSKTRLTRTCLQILCLTTLAVAGLVFSACRRI